MITTLAAALRDRTYLIWSGALLIVLGGAIIFTSLDEGAAGDVVETSPTSVPTPPPLSASQILVDARRILDLDAIAVALDAYRQEHGAVPTTENHTTTVCTSGFDPGCLLLSVAPKLPATDGYEPYWYRSDGTSYVLYSQIERADPAHPCPSDVPDALRPGDVYCLQHEGTATP